jgi:hypothetical protein
MMTNGIAQILNAGHPPTADEITAAQNKLWNDQYKSQLVFAGGQNGGAAINQDQVQTEFQAASAQVPEHETRRVAHEHMIYMDPATALTISQASTLSITNTGAGAPSPTDIWYAQLSLWIQQDVAKAIVRTNEGFANVIQAPVKQLVRIDVSNQPYTLPAGYQPGTPIQGDPKAPVPQNINASPTGRVCNPMYDVVHFDVTVDIEADKIPWFLDELNNGQFITVLQADVKPVDAAVEQTHGLIFGTKPIAELHLVCEEVFLHDWSQALMPKEVATSLQGVTTVVGAGGGGGGSSGTSPRY